MCAQGDGGPLSPHAGAGTCCCHIWGVEGGCWWRSYPAARVVHGGGRGASSGSLLLVCCVRRPVSKLGELQEALTAVNARDFRGKCCHDYDRRGGCGCDGCLARVVIPACRGLGGSNVNAVHYSCLVTSSPPLYYTPARSLHQLPPCLHVRCHLAHMSLEGGRGCDGCWARDHHVCSHRCHHDIVRYHLLHVVEVPLRPGDASGHAMQLRNTQTHTHTHAHAHKSGTRTRLHHHPRPQHTHSYAQSGHSSCHGGLTHAEQREGIAEGR
jgi:hypothetical protein